VSLFPLVLAGFLAQAGGAAPGPSAEARCCELLEQGRFQDLAAFLETLPRDAPLRRGLETRVQRLVGIRERLVEAMNRNAVEVDIKDVNPRATVAGRVVGATPTIIKVKGTDRERQMIWAGLPPGVTYELARRFLERESGEDASLLSDLAEGLGLGDRLLELKSPAARDVAAAQAVRKAISGRSLDQARSAMAGALGEGTSGCWGVLARVWVARIEKEAEELARRREESLKKLPKGTSLALWHDFEEGPELISPGWERGMSVHPPEGSSARNRWCRRSVFVGRGLDWGEMIDEFNASAVPADPPAPAFTLKDNTWVSLRVYASNVKTLLIALDNVPDSSGVRYSIVEANLPAMDRWVEIKARLDDVSGHKPFRGIPLVRVGDPVWKLIFKAHRADRNKDDGHFFLDEVRVYTMPPDEVEDK